MALNSSAIKCLLILALVDGAVQVPSPESRSSSSSHQQDRPPPGKLVELKLPVKITSMHDIVAWAKNAMRSMASRIDITLESVQDPVEVKSREVSKSASKDLRSKKREPPRESKSQALDSRRPVAPSALLSTYASLLEPETSFESIIGSQNEVIHEGLPHGNLNAYLPLFLDDAEIFRYREEALRKFYLEGELAKREQSKNEAREQSDTSKYSQAVAQQTSDYRVNNDQANRIKGFDPNIEKKLAPVISVPFEAIVTITREHPAQPTHTSLSEARDPPDEFPPYFEKDYPPPQPPQPPQLAHQPPRKSEQSNEIGDSSQKRQISALGDLLSMLGLTQKTNATKKGKKDPKRFQSSNSRPRRPSENLTPPPLILFEDQPQRQRRNETSQRQEFDDDEDEDEEEPTGSLGSITDLLPLVIPILEDISDPNTETDLGEVLEAALPLVQGLSEPNDDPDAPDVIGMIGPILTKIIGGKDGQGSDVAAVLGPAITLIAPLIGPVLGPLIGPLLATVSNPAQGEGSSLATLLSAILAPLTQPNGPGGMSPLSVLTAGVIAALSKELKPGLPGGLDVGAIVSSVLNGVIAGTSAGLSGGLSADKNQYQPYGGYGAGPVQAGTVNTGATAGFVIPGTHVNALQHIIPVNQLVPIQILPVHTTQRPFPNLQSGPQGPRPSSFALPQATTQHHLQQGPLQAGTNNGNGGSSYVPYGQAPAGPPSTNPVGLIGNLIKDILGAGIQVGSSVVNAIFGIIGSSSASSTAESRPVYGPPPQSSYGYAPR